MNDDNIRPEDLYPSTYDGGSSPRTTSPARIIRRASDAN